MFIQLALGSVLLLLSIAIAGFGMMVLERALEKSRGWLGREPHRPKMALILCLAALWVLLQMTMGVWVWAVTLMMLGLFDALEPAVYFALTAFTTLGFGDVLLPQEWRLLGGLAAVNGLLNIGLLTALMLEGLRSIKQHQISLRGDDQ